jgi:hypothetical protein
MDFLFALFDVFSGFEFGGFARARSNGFEAGASVGPIGASVGPIGASVGPIG